MSRQSQLESTMTAALASSDYQDLLAEADESSIGVPIDNITEIVAGTLPTVPTPVASVVQAAAAPGHLRSTMHWGVSVAEHVASSLAVPSIFGVSLFGEYGSVVWGTHHEDMASYAIPLREVGTAVDLDGLASDMAGGVRAEEDGNVRDLCRLGHRS